MPCFNPLTPVSDQDRISPYNFETTLEQTSIENKENYQLGNYQLIIQTSDENKEKYQLWDY